MTIQQAGGTWLLRLGILEYGWANHKGDLTCLYWWNACTINLNLIPNHFSKSKFLGTILFRFDLGTIIFPIFQELGYILGWPRHCIGCALNFWTKIEEKVFWLPKVHRVRIHPLKRKLNYAFVHQLQQIYKEPTTQTNKKHKTQTPNLTLTINWIIIFLKLSDYTVLYSPVC